jgi:hypothetical protein
VESLETPRPTQVKGGEYLTKADAIYGDLVSRAGLYGKAFFGHKTTKAERSKLDQLWRYAQKQVAEEQDRVREFQAHLDEQKAIEAEQKKVKSE